ncbi:ATP-grasp domain-containing protein [Ornithinimicrobium avium]|uniref:ATP-grasp domain-containing protein n=2 Tax=Ornithinimicrobium avium TaxID=2283195 RepID=A0A345NSS6_9MICO|nr:ATP-grasp domain-containing protein [Ornithinimicrobium avium]
MISPGFPVEQSYFTRALAQAGAEVVGVGDQPEHVLPPEARANLVHYQQAPLGRADEVLDALVDLGRRARIDRVECLWEPYVLLAAMARERLGLPGMTVDQALLFRDKELMKQRLDEAGIRTPRHASATTAAEVWAAAERIGYPLIVKPIAGAGSADTYRVDSAEDLAELLPMLLHVRKLSVEEFINGDEEYTYDTVCADGEVLFENISWYRPRPLIGRSVEWISPQTVALRDIDAPHLQDGREMGRQVLQALEFDTGFTHMEWFRTPGGETVFGEIGARPPGARSVDIMNFSTDGDLFRAWAEAVTRGTTAALTKQYNALTLFKRARGLGRITRIEGLEQLVRDYREHLCVVDLLPVGARRRDWRATLLSDGMVIARHPDLDQLTAMADRIGHDLQIYAS